MVRGNSVYLENFPSHGDRLSLTPDIHRTKCDSHHRQRVTELGLGLHALQGWYLALIL